MLIRSLTFPHPIFKSRKALIEQRKFFFFLRNLIKSSVDGFTSDPGRANREGKKPPEISDFSQKFSPGMFL